MSLFSTIKKIFTAVLKKSSPNQSILNAVTELHAKKIIEIGLGDGSRTLEILELAATESASISYTGIDLFDARTKDDPPGLTIKEAHQLLKLDNVKIRLLPGTVDMSIPAMANSLTETDIVIISAEMEESDFESSWFFFPRMLHPSSRIFWQEISIEEETEVISWREISVAQIDDYAAAAAKSRKAARRAA